MQLRSNPFFFEANTIGAAHFLCAGLMTFCSSIFLSSVFSKSWALAPPGMVQSVLAKHFRSLVQWDVLKCSHAPSIRLTWTGIWQVCFRIGRGSSQTRPIFELLLTNCALAFHRDTVLVPCGGTKNCFCPLTACYAPRLLYLAWDLRR